MTIGFVIVRHVINETTNEYWKESYRCIRKYHPEMPILLIDDSSNPEFLVEDIILSKCTVIYDRHYKGRAELLPYYYFHLLKPFDTAVILHDSVFLQRPFNIALADGEPYRGLWSFTYDSNHPLLPWIKDVSNALPHGKELMELYDRRGAWHGFFGVMSMIRWDFLHVVNQQEQLFDRWLPEITDHGKRQALERVIGMLFAYHRSLLMPSEPPAVPLFGDIGMYTRWGTTFAEYKERGATKEELLLKVWTGR